MEAISSNQSKTVTPKNQCMASFLIKVPLSVNFTLHMIDLAHSNLVKRISKKKLTRSVIFQAQSRDFALLVNFTSKMTTSTWFGHSPWYDVI